MKEYAEGPMKGILDYTEEELVSSDFKGDTHSSIFSAIDTQVFGGNLVKVVSLVRQRMGLLQPRRRSGRIYGQQDVTRAYQPAPHSG